MEQREQAQEQDSEQLIERVAALDIGKALLVCFTRVPGENGKRVQQVKVVPPEGRSPTGEIAQRLVLSERTQETHRVAVQHRQLAVLPVLNAAAQKRRRRALASLSAFATGRLTRAVTSRRSDLWG